MSKVFERIVFNQINKHVELFLSNILLRFRKNHYRQHYLLKMLEKWKEALDEVTLLMLSSWISQKHSTP